MASFSPHMGCDRPCSMSRMGSGCLQAALVLHPLPVFAEYSAPLFALSIDTVRVGGDNTGDRGVSPGSAQTVKT